MPDVNVVDDHFGRELGASGAARCGMLVTAMSMIMQKRLPGPNGQSGTWIRSISPPAAHGLLVPSAHQAGHTPASGVTMIGLPNGPEPG
jgi:hypothetical protein